MFAKINKTDHRSPVRTGSYKRVAALISAFISAMVAA
jgi:hypothetical protein